MNLGSRKLSANCIKGTYCCQRTYRVLSPRPHLQSVPHICPSQQKWVQSTPGGSVDIDVRKQSNTNIIRLRGDLKIGQAAEDLKRTLGEFLANNEVRFVVNMQDVNMVDSSGIGVLVRSLTSAKQRGGSLKLVNPSKLTLQTLKMVGLLPLFEVYSEEAQAVAAFA